MKTVGMLLLMFCTFTAFAFQMAFAESVVTSESYWGNYQQRPFEDKITAADSAMIEYLTKLNQEDGFPEVPESIELDPSMKVDFQGAINELPAIVKAKLNSKTTGIVYVQNLGTSGLTALVTNSQNKVVSGFVVIDVSALDRSANEWTTWKENTPFRPGDFQLTMQIEETSQDNRKNALQYILLHELGHVFHINHPYLPKLPPVPSELEDLTKFKFTEPSWLSWKGRVIQSRFEEQFPLRKKLPYYALENRDKLPNAFMPVAYAQLLTSNFPTLYGATNPFDDFAETFVSYIHTVVMMRPWKVTIESPHSPPQIFHSCWSEARCEQKRNLIEEMLASD